jgi:hypothetical protein
MTAKRVSDAISPTLARFLLIDSGDAADAVNRIANRPELIAEAKEVNAEVQRRAAPIGQANAMAVILPLTLIFDPPSFGKGREGEALERAWSMTYAKAIAHLPREALESAVEKYAQVGKWFPKPADLIELARPKATEILQLSYRLDRCATVKAREPVSDAERAEFQAFARDLAESLRTKTLFAGRVRECAA